MIAPKEDQMLLSKEDMKEQLAGFTGNVVEEIIFNVQQQVHQTTSNKLLKWRVL